MLRLRVQGLPWLPALFGALGVASAAAHPRLAPGIGAAGIGPTASALVASASFWLMTAASLLGFLLLPWLVAQVLPGARAACAGSRTAAVRPLLYGAALPLLATPFEPWFFRCPSAPLVLAGVGLGALGAAWRLRALLASQETRADAGSRIVVAVVLVGAVLVAVWPAPQGDEPHSLLVAQSLLLDGDIDLADDYGSASYRGFHPGPLSPHYRPGLRAGSRYSMHGLGYPLVLFPAFALGSLWSAPASVFASRLFQVLLYALFSGALYRLIETLADRRAALAGTLATVVFAPMIMAPLHLFSETPAMTAAVLATVCLWLSGTSGRQWAAGALLAALPWLGVKYIPVAICLAVLGPWARRGGSTASAHARVLLPVLISLAAHGAFTFSLYGSWSPSAIYLGSDPGFGRQPGYGGSWMAYLADWPNALRTLVGYFLDQKEGLLAIGPHFLLGAAGVPWLVRRRPRVAVVLMAVLLAHLGPYALSQQAGGHSPPARPLMAVAWTLAVPLGIALAASSARWVAALRGSLLALGAVITAVLVRDPSLLPHDYGIGSSWLLRSLSPAGGELWRWFPLWLNIGEPNWPVAGLWALATVALAIGLLRSAVGRARHGDGGPSLAAWGAAAYTVLALACYGLFQARTVLSDRQVGQRIGPGISAWIDESVPAPAWVEPGGVWVTARESVAVTVTLEPGVGKQRIWLRTLVPADVVFEAGPETLRTTIHPGVPVQFDWVPGNGTESAGGRAYRYRLYSSAGATPSQIDGGGDQRLLGVFMRLEAVDAP